ncbi:lipocalin family protein [Mucilaginibacter glaciei]|uniref:Outer membrane lipoprotein Blc n=1 Tax=Mucilaginibacter glaciei TaxID=2772109 RepID=A0A926S4A3_9SPHI|nr:lipocalin family protein [Mucilaginibacter glaciei]MBD1391586.1 lipocalin family protein [Mucilaginibacter glaciei]
MKLNKWQIVRAGVGTAALMIGLSSCVSIPKGAKAVKPFNKDKYLGKWYEICRMDFKFEKNLNNVTANYNLKDNGTIRVDNKGYNYLDKEWKESIGKAKLVGNDGAGRLKVSFFGPFYSGYNVIAIDKDYKYAMVAGNNLNYLWLLSRETTIPPAVISDYLKQAKNLGYNVKKLVWTKHDR